MVPSDLASFLACHEARDHVGSIGDPVGQLLGKYGGPAGQVQGTAGKKPVISSVLGQQTLFFDDTDDCLLMNAATTLARPYTVFTVFHPRSLGGLHRMLAGDGTGGGGTHNWFIGPYSGRYTGYAGTMLNGPFLDPLPIRTCCMVVPAAGNARFYVDNANLYSDTDGNDPGVISHGVNPGGYNEPANSDWIGTILFNTDLSDTERNNVYNNYIITDLLAGFNEFLSTQMVIEAVSAQTSEFVVSQFCIEYIRAVGNPFYHTQVIG